MSLVEVSTVSAAPDATALREKFLLDPDVVFLNHGSFGACPAPVFAEYQRWQRELERQPVAFFQRRQDGLLDRARHRLATALGASADDLVFVPNATSGLNVVARSLGLEPGDEVLTTDHEYGALDLTWSHLCERWGAHYVKVALPVPVTTPDAIVEAILAAVTPATKVIFLSHITSPTALIFPVAEICRRAREMGIMTVIDGAHAPGQIDLDLDAIGADAYSGNCHKWLCGPKGSAFLHVRPEHQDRVEALSVSWGWGEGFRTHDGLTRSQFIRRNQWQGTRDPASYLAVPAALDFLDAHHWDAVRERCFAMATGVAARVADLTGLPSISPLTTDWISQMVAMPIPTTDPVALYRRLLDDFRIEIPLVRHGDHLMIRVSVQGYTTGADLDALVAALDALLPSA